jgi:uncharacterized protein
MTIDLSDKQGEFLLKIARKSILHELNSNLTFDKKPDKDNEISIPHDKRGTFVTLHKNKNLRGCIGIIEPVEPITIGIKQNAKNAAFNDPRFPPVNHHEMQKITLEISILTKPVKMEYKNIENLFEQLLPHEHGVIIKKDLHKATFLPQVWEQLPDKKTFLSNLCNKAGLKSDEWSKGEIEVRTYFVQHFKEK